MPSSDPVRRFQDIVENVDRIESYLEGYDLPRFRADTRTVDAVERCLQRITEAGIKLQPRAVELLPDQDWNAIRGFGNALRHDYDLIAEAVIWEIATGRLPQLPCRLSARDRDARGGSVIIGYARISTEDQRLDGQHDALAAAGAERVFSDTISGATRDRPQLGEMIRHLRAGDVVMVTKYDRLARSLRDLLDIVATIEAEGAGFRSLAEDIDTTTPAGRLIFHVFRLDRPVRARAHRRAHARGTGSGAQTGTRGRPASGAVGGAEDRGAAHARRRGPALA